MFASFHSKYVPSFNDMLKACASIILISPQVLLVFCVAFHLFVLCELFSFTVLIVLATDSGVTIN